MLPESKLHLQVAGTPCPVNQICTLPWLSKPARSAERAQILSETLHHRELRQIMRSELVYEAGLKIENRFLLATTAMQATRKLHKSSTRTEDTVNRVLAEVAKGQYAHGDLPEVAPPPAVGMLLIPL